MIEDSKIGQKEGKGMDQREDAVCSKMIGWALAGADASAN